MSGFRPIDPAGGGGATGGDADTIFYPEPVLAVNTAAIGKLWRVSGESGGITTVQLTSVEFNEPAIGFNTISVTPGTSFVPLVKGIIEDVDTSTWPIGTILYQGQNGAVTDEPSSVYTQEVGIVLIQDVSGRILVDVTSRTVLAITEVLVDCGDRDIEAAL